MPAVACSPDTPTTGTRALFACATAAFGAFLFGYDGGAFVGAQIFVRQHFQMVPLVFGAVAAALMFGCLLATMGGHRLQERFGARTCLRAAAALFAVGSLGAALASSPVLLLLFRVLSGVATGIISIAAPTYVTEVAPPSRRGRIGLLYQLALTVGQLLALALGWFLAATLPPDLVWRWLLASTALPSVVLLLLLKKLPESPHWLMAHRREAEALAVMQTIRHPAEIAAELDGIRAGLPAVAPTKAGLPAIASAKAGVATMDGSYRDLLGPGIRWALLTGILLGVFNNWTGGTGVSMYLPTLFQQGGFPAAGSALAITLLVSCVNVGFTVLSIWMAGRVGRRALWMSTAAGMAVSVALLGWAYNAGVTGPVILGLTLLVIMCHALGLAPLPWLMISELYSGPMRIRAVSVCTTLLWLSGFTCVLAFPPLAAWSQRQLGSVAGAFWVFAVMSLLALLFGWRLLPETKGKTLDQIARHWQT